MSKLEGIAPSALALAKTLGSALVYLAGLVALVDMRLLCCQLVGSFVQVVPCVVLLSLASSVVLSTIIVVIALLLPAKRLVATQCRIVG